MTEDREADIILIMAPIGADAANISAVLARAGNSPRICRMADEMRVGLAGDCGAIVVTEEALTAECLAVLVDAFRVQPAWSDIPVVLIASAGPRSLGPSLAARLRGPRRTITLLERPLRSVTLVATLETLLAARHRQYEIRSLLQERDKLLSSLETRVAERTAALKAMVEEMESFSYSVSHDLRSPLRSLAGYAEALQTDYGAELSAGARDYCDRIIRAARRMDSLTQDVLAYTRVTRCEMEITAVDLDSLLAEVIEQYPALVASAGRIEVKQPLGCVKGHVPSLLQCFSNLLGNALKFTADNVSPRIEVRSERVGTRRRISVKDNGLGIAAEDHARIFRMFERAADKKVPGTGIGLAIVKKAVERMGGTIGVISDVGDGAEFWIELEAAPEPGASLPAQKDRATFWSNPIVLNRIDAAAI